MQVVDSVLELIGRTPMVRLRRVPGEGAADVFAKVEIFNPGGSIKDRACLGMIEAAEKDGRLEPGATIIEPTAGNTGVGAALIGCLKGYTVICVMPEKFRGEKSSLVEALGGQVVFTPTEEGMARAIELVHQMVEETPGAVTLGQFSNPANPDIHERTTGAEFLEQMEGRIDAICLGAGTGGTFTGVCRAITKALPACERILVQPEGSVFDGSEKGEYMVEGIGGSFVPDTLDLELADRIESIPDRETYSMVRRLAREEGLLVGGSSGAIAVAAVRTAKRLGPGKRVACIFPDSAERYLSKFQFQEDYPPTPETED